MDEQRYQQHLLNIPKTEPFKICWCCITETSGLLKINDVSDFSFLYKSIADFEVIVIIIAQPQILENIFIIDST